MRSGRRSQTPTAEQTKKKERMVKMIRNKTYRNFIIIKNKLVKEKGYSPEEATKITHLIFENVLYDKGSGDRSAEYFYDMVLSAEDFAK